MCHIIKKCALITFVAALTPSQTQALNWRSPGALFNSIVNVAHRMIEPVARTLSSCASNAKTIVAGAMARIFTRNRTTAQLKIQDDQTAHNTPILDAIVIQDWHSAPTYQPNASGAQDQPSTAPQAIQASVAPATLASTSSQSIQAQPEQPAAPISIRIQESQSVAQPSSPTAVICQLEALVPFIDQEQTQVLATATDTTFVGPVPVIPVLNLSFLASGRQRSSSESTAIQVPLLPLIPAAALRAEELKRSRSAACIPLHVLELTQRGAMTTEREEETKKTHEVASGARERLAALRARAAK